MFCNLIFLRILSVLVLKFALVHLSLMLPAVEFAAGLAEDGFSHVSFMSDSRTP
jgi:hypothetical protein